MFGTILRPTDRNWSNTFVSKELHTRDVNVIKKERMDHKPCVVIQVLSSYGRHTYNFKHAETSWSPRT
jgi:hypothetical protein